MDKNSKGEEEMTKNHTIIQFICSCGFSANSLEEFEEHTENKK